MIQPLKFLQTELIEGLSLLVEEKNRNDNPKFYIQGPYLMADKPNQNRRIYPLAEVQREIERYQKQFIETKRAIGELNHPTTSDVNVNPANACHLVVDLKQKDDHYFIGRSLILETPMGQIVRSLLKDGIQLGISTRGLGQISEKKHNGDVLVSNFHLICFDIVHEPSVQNALLESVLESKQWILNEHGQIVEFSENAYNTLKARLSTLPPKNSLERDLYIRQTLKQFFDILKSA